MNGPEQRVTVIDLRIPFFRLVFFFVKVALAAIPAAIILSIIAFVVSAAFWAIVGGSPGFLEHWRM